MSEQKKEETVALTGAALKDILRTVIEETKKPSVLEQQKLDAEARELAARQEERKESGAAQREEQAQKKYYREKVCQHRGGKPDHSYAVFVHDDIGGYVLCQHCQGVVRPEQQRVHFPKNYQGAAIFDTALFNRLWQQTSDSGVFA